uniref:Flavodoxin-like domain-containing protein n=1 Tax=Odontella aurita TaxID=265563 RepID=A0A7S4JZ47_9STRA|mmetsp:Transcript_57441/g.171358  ORF Transcript_57441/g.171358 Transcript_57441/m.171358 type:complete len:182 (+) Transcript_57441:603-1148(+)
MTLIITKYLKTQLDPPFIPQAPLGCYKFRELCDAINEDGGKEDAKFLDGVTYAMLGLGDSKYTTFFQNPTAIDSGLTMAGARRIGPLGKADASGEGDDEQGKVIARWIEGIWTELAKVVESDPPAEEKMEKVHEVTVKFCGKIFEDFQPPAEGGMLSAVLMICIPVGIAVIVAALKGTLFT